jgi:hypothetical protein
VRRLWPIDGDDRFQIPHLLSLWGYPRELFPAELAVSWWYGLGTEGLFWYNSASGDPPHSAMLHVCISPKSEHPVSRRELYAVEIIAELRGIARLLTDPPTERQRAALLRFGWTKREDGVMVRDLRDTPSQVG